MGVKERGNTDVNVIIIMSLQCKSVNFAKVIFLCEICFDLILCSI